MINHTRVPAFKLYNTADDACVFAKGFIPSMQDIAAKHFFAQVHVDEYQLTPHPAPRYQYVITLKGKLKFTVSSGNTFIIEPGILLIAKDLKGPGHSWQLIEGEEWVRLYIVLQPGANDYFVEEKI